MLYHRWLQILSRHRDRVAVVDAAGCWTFAALAERLENTKSTGPVVWAHGMVSDLAVAVLSGWRDGVPVLPLEKDARPPDLQVAMPPGTAHLKLTPGIEGKPRAVYFSAEQIAADADRLVASMDLHPDRPNLAAVSPVHSYGFSSLILPLLLHGVPVHAVEVPFPHQVAEAIRAHDGVVVPAVPSMWRAWHRSGILEGAKISLAVSAGAPLSLELETAVFRSCGLKIHNFYGASECGGISFDTSPIPRTDAADLGTPFDGVGVSVHASGRWLVTSDAVAMGCEAPREGEILGGGRYLTRDSGAIFEGRLQLACSGADSINVAGRKIGPAKIEAALMASGLVDRARVYGVPSPDPERVEEVAAMVRLTSGTLEELRKRMTAELAGWEMPRHWEASVDEARWALSRAELKKRAPGRSA